MDMMPAPSGFTFASPSAQPLAADLVAMLPPGSRVLVTGAAGFIGSHLADQLLCRGYHVVGLDCFTDYYPTGLKRRNLETAFDYDGFTLVEDDLVTTELETLLARVDAVCHLAGQPGVRASWGSSFDAYVRQNVVASQRLLEALTHYSMPCVVASSSSVYGRPASKPLPEATPLRPVSPYGLTKVSLEQLVDVYRHDKGIDVTALRYFTVFGPRQRPDMALTRFIEAALSGSPIEVFGSGLQSRDFTFVSDAVDATIAALGAPSPIYNVGGGTRATVNELLSLIADLTGRELAVSHDAEARGDVLHTWADTTLARRELGWQPRTTLVEGLAAQIDWVQHSREAAVR